MSYEKYNWELIATDYNSPLFRNYTAVKGLYKYPKELGVDRLLMGIISRNNDLEYIVDIKNWEKVHIQLKEKVLADVGFVEELINRSHDEGEKFNQWAKEEIFEAELSKKTDKELIALLERFVDWQGLMYTIGIALPVLDFGDFNFIEDFLDYYLKKNCSIEEQKEYYAIFTEPIANSFAQDQEEELLRIMLKNYDDKRWLEDMKSKGLKEIRTEHKEFYADLKKHSERHAWVYYAYNGPESKLEDFFEFVKDYLFKREHPQQILDKLSKNKAGIDKKKKEFFAKYQPNKHEKRMLHLAGKFVWGKPRRKDYQSRSYYYAKKLQLEIAKRLYLSLDQIRSTPFDMIRDALLGAKEIDTRAVNAIKSFHIIVPNDDATVSILTGQEAEYFIKKIKRPHEGDYKTIKEIAGNTAFRGKVKGTVKVVNAVSDMTKMEYGDVLVSAQTNPSIIAAMKKSAAIVTDEGGLTCHASIVSREMNIPCVIGTKIATKVLKDGDKVEVDAEKGIIKKI